jgi:hypothetical protein
LGFGVPSRYKIVYSKKEIMMRSRNIPSRFMLNGTHESLPVHVTTAVNPKRECRVTADDVGGCGGPFSGRLDAGVRALVNTAALGEICPSTGHAGFAPN